MAKRRKSRKGINTTKVTPRWQRSLRAAEKGLVRQVKTLLAAAGLVWLLFELARALGGE